MDTREFEYELPTELIAQHPPRRRTDSRLMVLHRREQRWEHRRFHDLLDYVGRGDLLVLNDTRVIRARLVGRRATG
ncbi:MAG: S-adenosylmethionine:tRNA ribosyltransferase-isomerase, partial [Planctomycetes bacterium]|nr:S-adenosylmethionine:tRNA ribosyltransferase-isomerase [Planctomycetota bacterium]